MPVPLLEKIPPSPEVVGHRLKAVFNIFDPDPGFVAHSVPPPARGERASPDGSDIREMVFDEKEQVAQSVAESFGDYRRPDPQFEDILKDEETRVQRLGHGFISFIEKDYLPDGIVHVPDKLFGAAIWMPPGKWKTDGLTQASIAGSLVGVVSPMDLVRLGNALSFIERKHNKIEKLIGPHYYLAQLAISPYWQGRGYGDALLKKMLDRCDEEGATAYLEASSLRSVPLYKRNGFKTIAKGRFRGGTQSLHFMYRKPQTQ